MKVKLNSNTGPAWDRVLNKVQVLLQDSDWTQLGDSPLTDSQRKAWAVYRQALRDIWNKKGRCPTASLKWPVKPNKGD